MDGVCDGIVPMSGGGWSNVPPADGTVEAPTSSGTDHLSHQASKEPPDDSYSARIVLNTTSTNGHS